MDSASVCDAALAGLIPATYKCCFLVRAEGGRKEIEPVVIL